MDCTCTGRHARPPGSVCRRSAHRKTTPAAWAGVSGQRLDDVPPVSDLRRMLPPIAPAEYAPGRRARCNRRWALRSRRLRKIRRRTAVPAAARGRLRRGRMEACGGRSAMPFGRGAPLVAGRRLHARRTPLGAAALRRHALLVENVGDRLQRHPVGPHARDAHAQRGPVGGGRVAGAWRLARAAASPLRVRSDSRSRSMSATDASARAVPRPAGLAGVEVDVDRDKPYAVLLQPVHERAELGHRAAEPLEAADDQARRRPRRRCAPARATAPAGRTPCRPSARGRRRARPVEHCRRAHERSISCRWASRSLWPSSPALRALA